MTINPPHEHFDPARLARVVDEMRRRGAPELRAAWDDELAIWHAAEGTHRLRAAKILGLTPTVRPVAWRRSPAGRVRARFAALRSAHTF